jgi:protease-4
VKKYVDYLILVLFFISVVMGLIIIFRSSMEKESSSQKYIKDKIAVVELVGEIYFRDSTSSFIKKDVEYYVTKLTNLFKRKDVKGIVLKINSPGGSVAAVQRLYHQIIKLKSQYNKPVVCYVSELCASGGYYVASACDKIVSCEGGVIGSVGVLLQVGNISGLLKKIGVNIEVIKSSKYKDVGSMFREMLPEERQMFETLVNTAYEQFISAIIEGRKLSREEVMKFADGRVFIAPQAVELKMIDGIGDEEDAIEEVKKLAKIKGSVEILKEKPSLLDFFQQVTSETKFNFQQYNFANIKKFRFEYIFE